MATMYWTKDGGSSKTPFGDEMLKCAECGWAVSKRIDVIEVTGKVFHKDIRRTVCSKRCLASFLLRNPGMLLKVFMRGHARAS